LDRGFGIVMKGFGEEERIMRDYWGNIWEFERGTGFREDLVSKSSYFRYLHY